MKKLAVATMLCIGFSGTFAHAEETTLEKAETVKNKAADSVKKTVRSVGDKTCETINGKLECAAKQVKHSAQDGMDATKTKAKELQNKIDQK